MKRTLRHSGGCFPADVCVAVTPLPLCGWGADRRARPPHLPFRRPIRRGVEQTAVGPQGVDPARQAECRVRPNVTVEDLAVVADLGDDLRREVGGESEARIEDGRTLGGFDFESEEATNLLVFTGIARHIRRRQIPLLCLNRCQYDPIDRLCPLGIAIDDHGAERLLSLIHISEPTRRTPISYAV